MKQTRFQEGPPPARSRRNSFAQPRTPEPERQSWDNFASQPHIEVNSSSYRPGNSRTPRTYHGHSRNSSYERAYTLNPSPRGSAGPTVSGERILGYSGDGIRVYGESEQPQSQPPPRDTYTPVHVPRNMPPPEPPRSAPIRIPNNAPRPPPLHTTFHTTPAHVPSPPHVTYTYGASPHSYPTPEPLFQGFESLRLSSEPRSSHDTFHSHSTDNSGDRSSGVRRRRGSLREEDHFKIPMGSGGRDFDAYREDSGRPRHQRRRSSNGQTFLGPSPMSATHSRQPSEESVFLPAEDMNIPRRRNSLRERDQPIGYTAQQSYSSVGRRGGVTVHQSAYKLAEATGALGNGRDIRSEGPLPVVWIAVMGITGSGKSTFIQTATGDRSVGVNHGLRSCTREVEVHSFRIDGFQVNLIDTPGFDDNKRSETEVLQTISTYLAKAYFNQVFLNGIIYVHSILQTRMGGSGIRSLGIMEKLTGTHNLNNVLLVSNMWDALKGTVNNDGHRLTGQELGELREHELQTNPEFWKELIDMGASTARHHGGSWESAHAIIRRFLRPVFNNGVGRPMKLLLQEELVDGHKRLEETEVGKFINAKLYEGQQKLEQEISELRRKHQRTLDGYLTGNGASPGEIGAQLEEKKKGLNDVRKKAEILGRRVDQLVDDQGNNITTPLTRTSGTHAGLCNMM